MTRPAPGRGLFESHSAEIDAVTYRASPLGSVFSITTDCHFFRALNAELRRKQFHHLGHFGTALWKFFDTCDLVVFITKGYTLNRFVEKAVFNRMASVLMRSVVYGASYDILSYDAGFGDCIYNNPIVKCKNTMISFRVRRGKIDSAIVIRGSNAVEQASYTWFCYIKI